MGAMFNLVKARSFHLKFHEPLSEFHRVMESSWTLKAVKKQLTCILQV